MAAIALELSTGSADEMIIDSSGPTLHVSTPVGYPPANSPTATFFNTLVNQCSQGGLDIFGVCGAEDYNGMMPEQFRLPRVGGPRALVVVVGNSRAYWPHIVKNCPEYPEDPVDAYSATVITKALDVAVRSLPAPTPAYDVIFGPEPPPRRISLPKAAVAAGIGTLTASGMCVHPTFGQWIGLRAAVIIDLEGPPRPGTPGGHVPMRASCDCAGGCGAALSSALEALESGGGGKGFTSDGVSETWRTWVAVRDACPVGREWRYGENQLRYHYTHDRAALCLDDW